jgi:hypothetical protein
MGLVIALGGLGIGYGLWTDLLEVNGTVETGTVDATFTVASALEWPEEEGKTVGSCSASIVEQEVTEPVPAGSGSTEQSLGTDKVEISILNGYPGYGCDVTVVVTNSGTIPIKIDQVEFDNIDNLDGKVDISLSDGCWDDGLQLHAGETTAQIAGECKVRLEVLQAANEGLTGDNAYTFQGTFFADQWNEYTAGN